MATKTKKTTKAAAKAAPENTTKTVIEGGIDQFVLKTGVDTQKARYKAMRAIAYQAFMEAVEDQSFEELVERAIENADELPSGWTLFPKNAPAKTSKKVKEESPVEDEDDIIEEDDQDVEEDDTEDEEEDEGQTELDLEDEDDEDEEEEEKPAPKPARKAARRAPVRRKK